MSTGGNTKGAISGLDTNLQQGPFEFGPTQFDINSILAAIGGNQGNIEARYNQLGLGNSTMENQDATQQALLGQAAQGQLQTSEVGNPAFNPALQPAETNVPTSAVLAANAANSQAGAALGKAVGTGVQAALPLLGA